MVASSDAKMALTVLTAGLASLALIGLGVGLGASYPVFKLENPAQIMFTSAGLLYGVVALAYLALVVSLEAAPVWRHLVGAEAEVGGDLRRLGLLFLLSAAVGGAPLAVARRRLARLEF